MSFPIRFIARCTLELLSPCSISTGEQDSQSDMPFTVDANGLPMIPATSLAGMLRAFIRSHQSPQDADKWFGFQDGERGQASRVWIDHAHIHDEDNIPVHRHHNQAWSPFLAQVAQGQVRDFVRLNDLGSSDEDEYAKFDRQVLYEGTRFSFNLEVVSTPEQAQEAQDLFALLLSALDSAKTRLGASIHSGLGAFKLVCAYGQRFDLRQLDEFKAYGQLPVCLEDKFNCPELSVNTLPQGDVLKRIKVTLKPKTFFGVAGGHNAPIINDRQPHIQLMRARRVIWTNEHGELSDHQVIIPASSIKGALAHRVAFHDNCLQQRFGQAALVSEDNPAVQELFGFRRAHEQAAGNDQTPGRILLDDLWLQSANARVLMHTSIDHFTQGVRQNMLFTEEVLRPDYEPISFELAIERPHELTSSTLKALVRALDDLCCGRLTLGAGYGRGHGHFDGTHTLSEVLP